MTPRNAAWWLALSTWGVAPAHASESTDGAAATMAKPAVLFPVRGSSMPQGRRDALDSCLRSTAEDLGLEPAVPRPSAATPDEDELVRLAKRQWVFHPVLTDEGERIRLRLTAVQPGSSVLVVRSTTFEPGELSLRCASVLRDVVQQRETVPPVSSAAPIAPTTEAKSPGRPVMAVAGAVYGGYLGYSLQRAGGSDDARLTYPMVALGSGIGIGAALLVSDEFDIGAADAWFVSAAGFWPTLSGYMLAEGYDVQPPGERYLFGLLGSAFGLAGATVALSHKDMQDGDAAFTHSGGVVGTLVGGLTDLMIQGRTDVSPSLGLGYGSAIGVAVAGALVTVWDAPSAADVLIVDLSTALGGLLGAAALGPLVFSGDETPDATRGWLGGILGGMLLGSAVGYYIVETSDAPDAKQPSSFIVSPTFGWASARVNGQEHSTWTGGVHGVW